MLFPLLLRYVRLSHVWSLWYTFQIHPQVADILAANGPRCNADATRENHVCILRIPRDRFAASVTHHNIPVGHSNFSCAIGIPPPTRPLPPLVIQPRNKPCVNHVLKYSTRVPTAGKFWRFQVQPGVLLVPSVVDVRFEDAHAADTSARHGRIS